jgi:DNA-binding IclR family transcriptional regulator
VAEPPRYSIAAVDRALDLLEALRAHGPATLAELADAAQCTRPAAFRLLRTLQARGYAIQDRARGTWRLGARFPALARAATAQDALITLARPMMHDAADQAEEHIALLILRNLDCIVAALVPGPPALRRYVEAGTRLPLHAGPCRLLLAHAPAAVQARILSSPMPKIAPHTRTDRAWITADLPRLRARDFSVTDEELFDGECALATAVFDAGPHLAAVLCVISPRFRMRGAHQRMVLTVLRQTSAEISHQLGA